MKTESSPVLARLNGQTITEKEYKEKLKSLPKELRSAMLKNKRSFLEDLASERLLVIEAEKRNLDDLDDVKELIEQARRKILIAKLIELEVDRKLKLEPGESERYYETHKEEFMTPLLLRGSHILVKTEAEARSIHSSLVAGADFEELARAKSVDSTAIRGGDLGFFQKGRFIQEFEKVAFEMKKGELSAPFKTSFGFHVLKLTDRIEPRMRPFRDVQSLLGEKLIKEKRSVELKKFIEKLKSQTSIRIDDKALEAVDTHAAK